MDKVKGVLTLAQDDGFLFGCDEVVWRSSVKVEEQIYWSGRQTRLRRSSRKEIRRLTTAATGTADRRRACAGYHTELHPPSYDGGYRNR